ncbi:MAG TPA: hypothetical protein VE287_10775 [Actinopolymorphaceae bacterium]|jgi:hypothetical protein|nr:hypothetical protein [Actinopolymorphaceae bacterium]
MPTGGIDIQLTSRQHGAGTLAWMLVAFLVTFVVTRVITRLIRAGRGPFHDTTVGQVHVHHAVYGIFLMLAAGAAEFVYRPPAPWLQVLAVAFACGAALTLDEFALWFYLEDVYWSREGRTSVDAVLVAACVGGLLLLGADPLDADAGAGAWAAGTTIAVNLGFAFVALVKGKISTGLIGLVVPVVAMVGAFRLAKPGSPWARRWYPPDSRRLARARDRFPPDRTTRWDWVTDKIGGVPRS